MSRRHTWTDGPLAFLLEKAPGGVAWLETNGGSRESVDGALAIEILRLAQENERLKSDRWREVMAATEDIATPEAEAARDARLERLLAEQQARDAALVLSGAVAERSRIRRELLDAIAEESWTFCPARGERLKVLSADALTTRLDRILPEATE